MWSSSDHTNVSRWWYGDSSGSTVWVVGDRGVLCSSLPSKPCRWYSSISFCISLSPACISSWFSVRIFLAAAVLWDGCDGFLHMEERVESAYISQYAAKQHESKNYTHTDWVAARRPWDSRVRYALMNIPRAKTVHRIIMIAFLPRSWQVWGGCTDWTAKVSHQLLHVLVVFTLWRM